MNIGYMGLLELWFSQGICPVVGLQSHMVDLGFPGGSDGKKSSCNVGDLGSIPGSGRSPGEGNTYPLQYSGLENSMDYIVCGVTKSWTRLSNFHFQREKRHRSREEHL